ncbi:MAG: CaiB/BaiF CoA transferase family protein, partial [Candidatus Binatia bacterium]
MKGFQSTLYGIRVLDLTQFEAGPACTEVLAWLGAEVVKVENPKGGDPGRTTGAKGGKDGRWFVLLNANKKSITIDLKTPEGVELLKEMVKKADIFVENFAPGTIERLGLGYEDLLKVNPRIVYAQIKGFGPGSPYERNLALDTIGQASGGSMSVTGERGGRPLRPGPSVADTGSGMLLTIGIVSALFRARNTGKGAHVEVAMQDAVMQFIRGAF